jgi:hypothetical protein
MTPVDYIRLALKAANVIGVGQTPDAEDTNDCFIVLQSMLGQWSRKRWLVPNEIDSSVTSTGATSYTVGTGGNINIARPDCIEAAYVRLLPYASPNQQVDISLSLIDAHEDYAALQNKSVVGFPVALFYDSAYPLGSIYLYPVAASNLYEIHIITKYSFTSSLTLTTDLALPPEYQDAIIWNLACRVRPLFGAAPDATLVALAKSALNTVRGANAQIPILRMPRGVGWYGASRWAGHGIAHYASLG